MQDVTFVPTTTIPKSYTVKPVKESRNKSGPVTFPDLHTPEELFGDGKFDDCIVPLPK